MHVGFTNHLPVNEEEEMREIIQVFAAQLPLLIACVLMLGAASLKIGKEKGAGLIVTGAVGLALLGVVDPLVNALVLPRMLEQADPMTIPYVVWLRGFISSLCWAVGIGLIAVGTFVRPSMKSGSEHQGA